LAARREATHFSQRLAERWVRESADAVGLLYVDGHVRPYQGTTHTLPEAWSSRRRLCVPATTDIWVNQQDAQPLFVVTAPANDDLLAMLRREILPEVRRLVGERRVTMIFDREGWTPKFFRELHTQGFDGAPCEPARTTSPPRCGVQPCRRRGGGLSPLGGLWAGS